jgi:hypothetical protein
VHPRDGEQLFHNTFVNETSAAQSFAQEVTGEIRSTFDGSLSLSVACAAVGVGVVVGVRRTFPVNIPPHSQVTMVAFANLMDRSVEVLTVCDRCREVLAADDRWVTAARGVNGQFRSR